MSQFKEKKCGVLGATGTVGQKFIVLLSKHPYMKLHALGASARSAGKTYKEATRWKQTIDMPLQVQEMVVRPCKASEFSDCDVVFSGLDSDVAGDIEMEFLKADLVIFSNAKNYRRDPAVPLVVPLVNPSHLSIASHQRKVHNLKKGFLVTNSNCSTAGLVVPLKALVDAFGPLEAVMVQTMQAISGAGYPGVPSIDILDNIVPYIDGEEEKMEYETLKILGNLNPEQNGFNDLSQTKVSATCNRVAVIDGHTECVSVKFANKPAPTPEEVIKAFTSFKTEAQSLQCPSAPSQALIVRPEADRPQPRLDRDVEGGYAVTVGRVRSCPVFDIKFTLLVHNTVLGAAGCGIMNAEIAVAKGLI